MEGEALINKDMMEKRLLSDSHLDPRTSKGESVTREMMGMIELAKIASPPPLPSCLFIRFRPGNF